MRGLGITERFTVGQFWNKFYDTDLNVFGYCFRGENENDMKPVYVHIDDDVDTAFFETFVNYEVSRIEFWREDYGSMLVIYLGKELFESDF